MNSPKYGDRTAILKRNRPIWQSKDGQDQIDADESDVSSVSLHDISSTSLSEAMTVFKCTLDRSFFSSLLHSHVLSH